MADGCKIPVRYLHQLQGTNLRLTTVNNARALRLTEILRDYQTIQTKIAAYQATPPNGDQNEMGFVALKSCQNESRALLNKPYPPEMLHPPTASDEAAKRQLQR